ncbi:unnamed protein product [Effrenium voratum]|uniref:carbonic anhydrase n=1 Tax=Effrenium voratum TaxID=2562239 RepID=A0AA36I7B5_9DINO|nr:unnamed protein product [Effrenium voratum]CAJ1446454.1 unnamed protein product [Effrenium voratum]
MYRHVSLLSLWTAGAQEFPDLSSWSYEYQRYWQNIVGSTCSPITWQSPIDIPKSLEFITKANLTQVDDGQRLGPFAWSTNKPNLNVTLHPGPVTWEVRLAKPSDVVTELEGQLYHLEKITFKSPSEHTVQGAHNAMEAELYHTGKAPLQGGFKHLIASVSFRQDENEWNMFLNSIFSAMPQEKAASATITNPYLDLLPPDKSFVRYKGSSTVPPCEPATWIVFLEPQLVGPNQLLQFRSSISGYEPSRLEPANDTNPPGVSELWDSRWGLNNRMVQDAGGRELTLVQMANADHSLPRPNHLTGGQTPWISMLLLLLLALIACLLLICWIRQGTRKKRKDAFGRQVAGGWCDDDSESEEEGFLEQQQLQQQQLQQQMAFAQAQAPPPPALAPLPDALLVQGQRGFGQRDQIYMG